jgi:hypothetical protein
VRRPDRRALALGGKCLYPPCSVQGPKGELVRSANDPVKKQSKTKNGSDGRKTGKAVGVALRDAYDEALAESIPSEMLDLLKKLD